eukprot:132365_1
MSIADTENCPICLGDYEYLCELDCYLYRKDNVKHFMCKICVKRLFKSNRWYQRAKCPFCRHTIHKDVILNNSMEISEPNIEDEMKQQNNYINIDWNNWREHIQSWHSSNIHRQHRALSLSDR